MCGNIPTALHGMPWPCVSGCKLRSSCEGSVWHGNQISLISMPGMLRWSKHLTSAQNHLHRSSPKVNLLRISFPSRSWSRKLWITITIDYSMNVVELECINADQSWSKCGQAASIVIFQRTCSLLSHYQLPQLLHCKAVFSKDGF